VIDTGRKKIVYVESSPGVYDMREVKLGLPAEDSFPVISGLQEGERIVTVGAFLIDSENRLNPTQIAPEASATSTPAQAGSAINQH
jgi:Cu(I)/Ag(I) efflux system membrane fusion protein